MKYIVNGSTDPYFNMALDEWCLEHLPSGEYFFRLWQNSPSVIIGRSQDAAAEVNAAYLKEKRIALVRRSTGGGAVYHDLGNLNYSIWGPEPKPDVIVTALQEMGVAAELSGRNDIFVDGRKVSGYARRVFQDRELVHGTLMWDVDIDVLTRVLDTPGSKLNVKGVASVPNRVGNLAPMLPNLHSVEEFASAMLSYLPKDDEFVLTEEALSKIASIARYKRLSPKWHPFI